MGNNYSKMFKSETPKKEFKKATVNYTNQPVENKEHAVLSEEAHMNILKEDPSDIPAPAPAPVPPKKVYKTATVNVKYLNVRDVPASNGLKFNVLKKGDKVTIVNYAEDWCEIVKPEDNKKRAYVMTTHLS